MYFFSFIFNSQCTEKKIYTGLYGQKKNTLQCMPGRVGTYKHKKSIKIPCYISNHMFFWVEDFEFDTFGNVRGRTRGVGTRLGAQERTSTKNQSKFHVTYPIICFWDQGFRI